MDAKKYIEDVMYGRRKSFFIGNFLSLFSTIYGMAVLVRGFLYAFRFFRIKSLPCTVISVGNITLGGTGKTPTVIHIAGMLLKNRKRPVVLSRGFGRKNESEIVVVSDGGKVLAEPKTGGDEPVLIGSKLWGVPVVVGKDRYRAGLFAVKKFRPEAVVLDDGFQHRRLKRDINIALMDALDPFGNGKLFPAGILREPLTALKRADVVLITRADKVNDLEPLKAVIRENTRARIFTSYLVPLDLIEAGAGEVRPLSALRGMKVLAFSGIARPESFSSLLRSHGADIRTEVTYPDHYEYRKPDIASLFRRMTDEKLDMLVTTEKDAVRLGPLKPSGIWSLRIEQKVVETEEWEMVLLKKA